MTDVWQYEKQARRRGYSVVAGIDEAGRGPLAGPVVSAAVILPLPCGIVGLDDSKKLSPARREKLYDRIYGQATAVGIGIVDAPEIDRINILQAALLSMKMAVDNLAPRPDYLLIDGKFGIATDIAQEAIVKGDRLRASVSAASIVAKVTRDRLMLGCHRQFPQYGFDRHKGYPTRIHREALCRFGSCVLHRHTVRGVRERLPADGRRP
jgi:ribonuclease HII